MSEEAYCVPCEQQFKDARGLAAHNRFKHAPAAPSVNGAYDDDPDDLAPDVIASIPATVQAEDEAITKPDETERRPEASKPPERPRRGLGGLFPHVRSEKPTDGPREASPEKRPTTPKPRRVSTQDFWGDGVEGVASLVMRTGYVPMGRAMVWSSPVAGEIIEDATKGTLVDKVVQPVVRNAEKWQDLFDLIGFWAAIGMAQAQPEKAPMALMFARKRLVNLLPKIAANMAKQRKKERAAAEAIQTLLPELEGLELGDDPIQGLIEMLFAAPEQPPAPPQPEPAVA